MKPTQTLADIRGLLAAAGLAPQHRFGQNFLVDQNLLRKLVETAAPEPGDIVLEVGPGTGSLTELLLERGARVIAVEIDRGFQKILDQRLGANPRFTLIRGDALETKHRLNPEIKAALEHHPPEPNGVYKLVANLPYQIATPLLLDLLYATPRFERLTCTIQREVGQRLTAMAESDDYGPISVLAQLFADVQLVAILPPSVFWPRPKVESVMLNIRPRPHGSLGIDDLPGFVEFVQHGFGQRRKMLRRLLRDGAHSVTAESFLKAGVSSDARPEQLPPAAWRALFLALAKQDSTECFAPQPPE